MLLNCGAFDVTKKSDYVCGTSFPDIRYLGVIARDQTHTKNATWDDVINAPTSFEKGRVVHSLLDEARWEFVKRHHLSDHILVPTWLYDTVLKFYEDMLLYDLIKNWP